jgi:hypothetical protein
MAIKKYIQAITSQTPIEYMDISLIPQANNFKFIQESIHQLTKIQEAKIRKNRILKILSSIVSNNKTILSLISFHEVDLTWLPTLFFGCLESITLLLLVLSHS